MSFASFLHPGKVTVSKAVSDDINEKKKEAEVQLHFWLSKLS